MFFKVEKEFSHKAVKTPKVMATLNAMKTLGIASRALWKLLSSVFSVHFLSPGGVELSYEFENELSGNSELSINE